MIKEQIFWLQISMDNSQLVQVLNSWNYLLEKANSFFFFNFLILNYVVKKLSSRCKFSDKV